jgi:hypothetical protein
MPFKTMSPKKPRSDYSLIGEFSFTFYGKLYRVKVLADMDDILKTQGHLALQSNTQRNRQNYGPFRVTVTVPEEKPKQKRIRKKL